MRKNETPPEPIHIAGNKRGEEFALHSKEAGRDNPKIVRTARDSTGICAEQREPIIPAMPHIPPA